MQFFDQKLCCRGEGLVFSPDDKHLSLWNIFKGTEDDIASISGMNKLIKHYGITYAGFCHNSAIIGKVIRGNYIYVLKVITEPVGQFLIYSLF